MDVIKINGGRRLSGDLEVPGSKNAALALLSALVLAEGTSVFHKLPDVTDVKVKARLLEAFGTQVEWHEGTLFADATNLHDGMPDPDSVRSIRTSFYIFGPLLARLGRAELPAPGGCQIGARPLDFHLRGLAMLGAEIELVGGNFIGRAKKLRGAEIYLDFPSAGATQHIMATATLAEGMTVIHNAASEPEVTALAYYLNKMGARIEGAGTSMITIQGVTSLSGAECYVPADRVQAGTYLLAGAITGGDVTVRGISPTDQIALITKLREAGATVDYSGDWVRVRSEKRHSGIRVKTMPHPGFPTDLQQPIAAMLSLADGTSMVEETIYESRIGHIQELVRMGAKIRIEGRTSVIHGVKNLKGAVVHASDLRAGAALCLAGLAAEGETVVRNVHFIDRGYENFEETLRSMGADIERISSEAATKGRVGLEEPS